MSFAKTIVIGVSLRTQLEVFYQKSRRGGTAEKFRVWRETPITYANINNPGVWQRISNL